MVASARARSRLANTVAVCSRLACRVTARFCATWFQVFQMGAEAQNFAAAVWSAVRVVLTSWPRLLTSFSALA